MFPLVHVIEIILLYLFYLLSYLHFLLPSLTNKIEQFSFLKIKKPKVFHHKKVNQNLF